MSPYIVPDHVLERNLSTSLTPTFWGALTIVPFDSLDSDSPLKLESTSEVADESPASAKLWGVLSKEPENTNTPKLSKSIDLPAVPHPYLYFDDGNITLRAQGILYRLHRSLLYRGSKKFENLISQLSAQQESSTSPTIPLDGVNAVDFDAFLSILYPRNYNTLERQTFEQWSAILNLSTQWGFAGIRDLAIRCIKFSNPMDRLMLARKLAVEEWILPALLELCERPEPLDLKEARLLDFEDVVLVGSVRQTVRSSTLEVDGKGIEDCVRAWRSGKPWSWVPNPPKSPPIQNRLPQSGTTSSTLNPTAPKSNTGGISTQLTPAGDVPEASRVSGLWGASTTQPGARKKRH